MKEMPTDKKTDKRDNRLPWTSMKMDRVGQISQIVQGGGGKLSIVGGDPGDSRKPSGPEP